MSLADKVKGKVPATGKGRAGPLWQGPEQDGVTFSLLSRFLVCRERFRLLVVEGLRPADIWNHRTGYGNMWHVCEEEYAGPHPQSWVASLTGYCRKLCSSYPTQQEQIDHWYNVCLTQFPLYVDYWAKHSDVTGRTPLLQEQVFDVPYKLPSGRTVRLRGKWDSVDLIGQGKGAAVYLQENKTKGDIDEGRLKRQLAFDLQTQLYLIALGMEWSSSSEWYGQQTDKVKVAGVRYNVVRRPLSGGKGSIVRHKPTKSNPAGETKTQFYNRLKDVILEDPGYYFMRWQVQVTPADVTRFRRECLDPILEQLCDWWEWIRMMPDNPFTLNESMFTDGHTALHWRHPYGVWNILDEGGSSDLDEYLDTRSEVGLTRTDNLFPELE